MIVVDKYLAIRSLTGALPTDLPDEPLSLTTSAHWRILQRIHAPGSGQLSHALGATLVAGLIHGRQLWFGTERTSVDACGRSPTTSGWRFTSPPEIPNQPSGHPGGSGEVKETAEYPVESHPGPLLR